MASLLFSNCSRTIPRQLSRRIRISSNIIRYSSTESQQPKKTWSKANHPTSDKGPVSWLSLFIGGSTVVGMTSYFVYLRNQKLEKIKQEKTRSYGKMAIGGSYDLIDTEGKPRSSDEFKGKWTLVYFGFTHCPDVCPEELDKLATVIECLDKDKFEITPLFISVDPDRDTPEMVKKYLSEFSTRFIGLTGTKEQVERATRAFRVYYSVGPKDQDNDYIVDHTIISYLISPDGELIDYYGQTKTAPEIENSIIYHMKMYEKQQK